MVTLKLTLLAFFNFSDTLCSHFANGKAHGNLCRQFCVTRALQPQSCQTFHVGKEVVFAANLEETQPVSNGVQMSRPLHAAISKILILQVFVKGRRKDFMAHPEEALHWGSEVFPSESDFQLMVKSYLKNNMGIKLPEDNTDLMKTLWFKGQG